jgi:predicted RND superfamily exporter protein
VSFLALRISRVPMIRDFGVLLMIGIVVLVAIGIVVPVTVLGAREWHRRTARREHSFTERVIVWLGSMPTRVVPFVAAAAVVLVALGITLETRSSIQSDPIKWIDQDSQVVADVKALEDATGFATTLGILVEANNVLAPEVSQVVTEFVADAEALPGVTSSSSLVGTMAKVIDVPGATPLAPTSGDLQAALAVAPPDIARSLVGGDGTAAQVNMRLAPASLEERAVLIDQLEADLQQRLDEVVLTPDSVLDDGLTADQAPIRAVPAGLAVVGVSLLENLTANRAALTYVALGAAAVWLLVRFRSLTRTLLTLVPVLLAVGLSALVVGVLGIELSPLTTVSGPLVIATCVDFAVLITARYLEERKNGLVPRAATDQAASRTGRAFFTSGFTTVGGFATLIISPLPLLRDFGMIVSLNILLALLAALTVMPALLVFADERGWVGIAEHDDPRHSVRLAAPARGRQFAAAIGAAIVVSVGLVVLVASTRVQEVSADATSYAATALPTTTTTTTTLPDVIDPTSFGSERPSGIIGGTLFDLLTAQGVAPENAVCTSSVLLSRTTEQALIDAGIASFTDEALAPVIAAAQDCQVPEEAIDAVVTAARGG